MRRIIAGIICIIAFATPSFADPDFWKHEWPRTDFSRSEVSFVEIMSGGPPKDGIPALDQVRWLHQSDVQGISADEPVITLELPGERARAYPVRYLIWHEIVNDQVGETPVAVTYCPLCNSAITFDRRLGDQVLSFGVSGKLRASDMVMYDRETESWWQQALRRSIVGELMGAELELLPSWMEPLSVFQSRNPDGLVMAQPLGHQRPYGRNPYQGYDLAHRPFLYSGENPPHDIHPLMRVIRVGDRAWTMDRLREEGKIEEAGVRLSWQAGMASPLDDSVISQGRDIGWVRVKNTRGRDIAHDVMFAFAFHAFYPEGKWMR